MANVLLKDVPLVKELKGTDKFPISNGSNGALTGNIQQIFQYIESQGIKAGIEEAPINGKQYLRTDGTWEELKFTGYEDILSYGVQWNHVTESDPHVTRIGNPIFHKTLPIQSMYRGCVAEGKNIKYYLDSKDWSKKEDGTPSKLDGTDGSVYVHIPKFYGKSGIDGNIKWVRISLVKIDDTWIEIPEMLVSAYRVTVSNNKTYSVVNTTPEFRGGGNRTDYDQYLETNPTKSDLGKPRTAKTRAAMRTYARNSNEELLCYDYYKWIFYWNYVIEYANFNPQDTYKAELTPEGYHQGGLGLGVTTWGWSEWTTFNGNYPTVPCGYCNDLGNNTGIKELTYTLDGASTKIVSVPRWRGFDNPFGDIYTILEGIVLKREAANEDSKVYTTSNPSNYDDSLTNKTLAGIEIAKDGYIKTFDLGNTGEIIPSSVGASYNTHKCDYHYCNVEYTGTRGLWVGGSAPYGGSAGLVCFASSYSVGSANAYAGFLTTIVL